MKKELEEAKQRNLTLEQQLTGYKEKGYPPANDTKEESEDKTEESEVLIPMIETFEDFQIICNAAYSGDVFSKQLLKNITDKLQYNEPSYMMKKCLYPTLIQNKNLFISSQSNSNAMQNDAIALCVALKLFSLLQSTKSLGDEIKILCICPKRTECADLLKKINYLLIDCNIDGSAHTENEANVSSSTRRRADLIIPGQHQSIQQRTLRSRPDILITTPVLMTDFVLSQNNIHDYVSKISSSKDSAPRLFHCIVFINIDRCLQCGFDKNIESIYNQCCSPNASHTEQQMLITCNSMSSLIEQFVFNKLLRNHKSDTYKLLISNMDSHCDADQQQEERKSSDFLASTNDDELNDKVTFNTLEIQKRLQKKRELLSGLNGLLNDLKYASSASTIEELKDGTYHQQFNKSASNLTAKLDRMESKKQFMSSIASKLAENNDIKYMQSENERLSQELKESEAIIQSLEEDKINLSEALKRKIARIRQIEEERGIVIGELRISLEEMSNSQNALRQQMNEEKNLLTDNLKQIIEQLTLENQQLKQQVAERPSNDKRDQ